MELFIVILFVIVALGAAYNAYMYHEKREAVNFSMLVLGILVSFMMIAQYLVAGLR